MNRRGSVLALLALGVATVPFGAKAQHARRLYQIGFVSPTAPGPRNVAFLQGLRELGYVEGHNVNIEMRFAEGRPERLPGLVEEVIRLKVDVLVVGSTIGARAAKSATSTIPIVFAGSSDPVAGGIVANLSRPGGNITGFSLAYGDGFAGKWLELLKEAAPNVSHVAALWTSLRLLTVRGLPRAVGEFRVAPRPPRGPHPLPTPTPPRPGTARAASGGMGPLAHFSLPIWTSSFNSPRANAYLRCISSRTSLTREA